jgi:hypothetical protein
MFTPRDDFAHILFAVSNTPSCGLNVNDNVKIDDAEALPFSAGNYLNIVAVFNNLQRLLVHASSGYGSSLSMTEGSLQILCGQQLTREDQTTHPHTYCVALWLDFVEVSVCLVENGRK